MESITNATVLSLFFIIALLPHNSQLRLFCARNCYPQLIFINFSGKLTCSFEYLCMLSTGQVPLSL